VREQLTAGSRYAFTVIALPTGSPRSALQYRTATGGLAGPNATTFAAATPYWVRLVRAGDVLTSYVSANGTAWTLRGSVTLIGLSSTVLVGLAVTSHNDGQLTSAQFDNVSVATN